MVFGKNTSQGDSETHISETQNYIDIEDEVQQSNPNSTSTTSGSRASGSQGNKQTEDITKPLNDEVVFHGAGNSKNPGGSKQWTCKHCQGRFTSTYTRIHVHFFGPPVGKKAEIKRCPAVLKDRELFEKLSKKVREAENSGGVSKCLKNSVLSKNAPRKRMEEAFGILERNAVDLKIIRGLCANGIPFNVLRNPHFIEMISAIKNAPGDYKPPSCEKARTNLLDECVRDVEKELAPVKDTWYTQGVSIVSDGWSNVKHNPLINVLAVNSRGAMFMEAGDFLGVEKTGTAIANFLLGAIETIGPSNVLQVVTDNAANCKSAGTEIEQVYKHIFWSPCVVHTLNLVFKDLANAFFWLFDTYKKGKAVVKFFLNHTHALSFFRENSKLELLKVAKTRFASHYILLRRLLDCREALATTIVLNSWREWFKKGDEKTRTVGSTITETIKDDLFWENVENILAITKPIYLLIKFCDGDGPKMGEVYERMDNMLGEIKDVMKKNKFSSDFPVVEQIVLARWEKMTIPLHCLAFALTPRFYDSWHTIRFSLVVISCTGRASGLYKLINRLYNIMVLL
ncbi:putative ribonuclease H-like superfamily [Helianthus annuus]|nr:putative ribonuclease H-like superfamily [Helianthus annuus]